MIYGERVRQVRKLRGYTQKALADAANVKQATISQIENGVSQPTREVLEAIAFATGFPVQFFERAPGPEVPLGSLAFRARASVKVMDIEEAHAWTELAYECAFELSARLGVRPASLPNLSNESPEKAAQIARSLLGLSPDKPIRNLIHALEQFGIFVLALPIQLDGRDAWSAWIGINPRYPVIVLPSGSLGGRLRFTVAHELDHLLAPDLRGNLELAETAADSFASELLLPESGISDDLDVPITTANVIPVARRWGVSPQFVVRRAAQLRKISQRRAQQVYQQLSAQGFARQEPPGATIRVEKPRLFKRLAEMAYGIPVDLNRFAADFAFPPFEASSIMAAHAERSEVVATVSDAATDNVVRFPTTS